MQNSKPTREDRTAEDDERDAAVDDLRYRETSTIDPNELKQALSGLVLLGDDPYLRMQVTNIAIVDPFIMQLEDAAYQSLFDGERNNLPELVFLGAQSQMWMFAAYELLRTWRKRARKAREWIAEGILQDHIDDLERDIGYRNFGRQIRADQLRKALVTEGFVDRINDDLARTYIPYRRLDALRVILAKHELPKKIGTIASAPGYGRINPYCGALDYDLQIGNTSLGLINRRDVADELRAIRDGETPAPEHLESFDAFMKCADHEVPKPLDRKLGKR